MYPVLIKTRRYRSYLKLHWAPISISLIIKELYIKSGGDSIFMSINLVKSLFKYFLSTNFWYFMKDIIFKSSGLLISNIDKSYVFYTLRIYKNTLSTNQLDFFDNVATNPKYLVKPVRILPFSTQKFIFKRKIIFILFYFFNINIAYINFINISYCFLLLSKSVALSCFYSYYYFKIHNY